MDAKGPQQPCHASLCDRTPASPVGPRAILQGDQPVDQVRGPDGLVGEDLTNILQQANRDGIVVHRDPPGQGRRRFASPRRPVAARQVRDREGSVATFGITRESPLGGPRYTANPNTLWIRRV